MIRLMPLLVIVICVFVGCGCIGYHFGNHEHISYHKHLTQPDATIASYGHTHSHWHKHDNKPHIDLDGLTPEEKRLWFEKHTDHGSDMLVHGKEADELEHNQ